MSLFDFSVEELLTFVGVLVRYSVLVAVLPFLGDRVVPGPVKVLFSLALTVMLFPTLVRQGDVRPGEALVWGQSVWGIVSTVGCEAIFGLVLGYSARLVFDAISFGANLAGTAMGFAMASFFDPHQETQTQVVAEVQLALAMLLFLALDGHHLILRAGLESYQVVGLGKLGFSEIFAQRLTHITGLVLRMGFQLAAPVALSIFAVNIAFGVLARAMPQLNVLVLSFSVTALVGLTVLFIGMSDFQVATAEMLSHVGDWMQGMSLALAGR